MGFCPSFNNQIFSIHEEASRVTPDTVTAEHQRQSLKSSVCIKQIIDVKKQGPTHHILLE